MVEMASNLTVYERNQEFFFNYCLHATTKDAIKHWKDSPLPFPDRNAPVIKRREPHYGGLDQIPQHIPVKRIKSN
jgi:hypothetical protein